METNLNNLPPFYSGQPVVMISFSTSRYKNGDIGNVKKQIKCECGEWYVSTKENSYGDCTCVECGNYIGKDSHVYRKSTAFAPIQQQSFPLMTFEKIAESEQKKETEKQLLINN